MFFRAFLVFIICSFMPAYALAEDNDFIEGVWHDQGKQKYVVIDNQARTCDIIPYVLESNGELSVPIDEEGKTFVYKGEIDILSTGGPQIFFKVTNSPVQRSLEANPDGTLGFFMAPSRKEPPITGSIGRPGGIVASTVFGAVFMTG